MELRSRPATTDDIRHFYPGVGCSFKAMVCEMDGAPAGIIGIALARPVASIFCTFREALRPHIKSLTVLRLLWWLKDSIAALRGPVFAIREKGERQAVHILKRLGFRFHGLSDEGDAVYRYEGRA